MRAEKCILFCASQRSGSTLIHDDFHNLAGAYGRNAEWLYGEIIRNRSTKPWPEVWAEGAALNRAGPWVTAKVMFHYTPHISGFIDNGGPVTRPRPMLEFHPSLFDPFHEFFQDAIWVYVERRDVFEQAASMIIAQASKLWEMRTSQGDGSDIVRPEVEYDGAKLRGQYNAFMAERTGWQKLFAHYGIRPVCLAYEDAIADYPAYLDELMARADLRPVSPAPPRRLVKVGTALNSEFADRLRAEIG